MLYNFKFNFTDIRNIIEASELLQSSGKDEDSADLLENLAKDILNSVSYKKKGLVDTNDE